MSRQVRPACLINRAETRRFILAQFESHRPQVGISRVSAETLDQIEFWLRNKLQDEVHRHPSVGSTFKL